MPTYRYQVCDLLTDTHITDLTLSGVRFDRRIVKPGALSATAHIPNRAVAELVQAVIPAAEDDLTTGPGRVICHVWRNNVIWGSYILWRGEVRSDRRGRITVSLSGATLESWLHRVIMPTKTWTDIDQLVIAREILVEIQTKPITSWNNLRIIGGGPATSGILRTRRYSAADVASVGERLEQLAEVISGPEWMIRTYDDGTGTGTRVREFYVDQIIGATAVHRVTQPGAVLEWRHIIDASDAATRHRARGGDDGTGRRAEWTEYSEPHRDDGWPEYVAVHDYPTVTVGATIEDYARWWMTYRSGALHTLEVTVRVPENPTLGPDQLGDYAHLTLVNDWWPIDEETGAPTFNQIRRVIGMEVTPPERGRGEEATLILEGPREIGDTTARGEPLYPAGIGERLARAPAERRAILSGSAPAAAT